MKFYMYISNHFTAVNFVAIFQNQEIPESSKSNSSNSSTKDRDTTNMEPTKKKACDRVERGPNGEVLSYTTEDDITYRISGMIAKWKVLKTTDFSFYIYNIYIVAC